MVGSLGPCTASVQRLGCVDGWLVNGLRVVPLCHSCLSPHGTVNGGDVGYVLWAPEVGVVARPHLLKLLKHWIGVVCCSRAAVETGHVVDALEP